ncbi:MAG: L,D-transpeptidase [Ahrensia sp.]|nr:L,D-transpeptidase [Ahrensia sp.]
MDTTTTGTALSRRRLLSGAAAFSALALTGCAQRDTPAQSRIALRRAQHRAFANFERLYGPITTEEYPLEAVNLRQVDPRFFRREVRNTTGHPPGTMLVDTKNFYLYWTQNDGTAMRYGVGLGRQGFEWSGRGRIQYKRQWPKWTPPSEMIEREPELEKWSAANGGMPPGPENPLGARALYIFQDGRDTLYRVHGSPEAFSIGRAVSSGCVRLLNHDIIDLYDRVTPGGPIIVV